MIMKSNERGSALLLSLFMVLLLMLLMTPLLLSLSTGYATSAKGGNWEQANYIAESGTSIARRALLEAVTNYNVSLGNDEIKAFINNDFKNNPPKLYENTVAPVPELRPGKGTALELITTGEYGIDQVKRKKQLSLEIKVTTGDGSGSENAAGEGIFATNVVVNGTLNSQCTDQGNTMSCQSLYEKKMRQPDYKEIVSMNYVSKSYASYEEEFMAYYQSVFSKKPERTLPLEVPASPIKNSSLSNSAITITETENRNKPALSKEDITIKSSGSSSITIDGDVISAKDVIFDGYFSEIVIKGNLYAGGSIRFTNSINTMTVKGALYVNNDYNGRVQNLTVGGPFTGKNNVSFESEQQLRVGGSIISGSNLSFQYLPLLEVQGSISGIANVTFQSQGTNNAVINGYVVAGNQLTFHYVNKMEVLNGFSAKNITFAGAFHTAVIKAGSIVSDGDLNLQWVKNINVSGDISGTNITFSDQEDVIIGGTIYASDNLRLAHTRKLEVGGSIYAGSKKGAGGMTITNNLDNVLIKGTLLTTNDLTFPYIINTTVKSFVGSLGTITIRQTSGDGSLRLGGITAGNGVKVPEWNVNDSIVVDFFPPTAGQEAPKPTIKFGNWKNT